MSGKKLVDYLELEGDELRSKALGPGELPHLFPVSVGVQKF